LLMTEVAAFYSFCIRFWARRLLYTF